ncbi:glycosyltransferase family 4 protein [Ruegeria sp. AU67]|uniref:glycosyltransferase family 4 protein n=1 Tax=Ruegeria sp. AU67 TaxID=2108530 RepID=UPI000D68DB23|nr:glycosyltransferase family 4 protein [Ruegeria sp. AU67]
MPINVVNIPYGNKNPYQSMMYSACMPEFSLTPSRGAPLTNFARADFQPDQGIIHIHWDDRLFPEPETEDQAPIFNSAREGLRRYRANGGRVIWTIHNQFAHSKGSETEYFRQTRRELAQIADVIHVHTRHARQHMIDEYDANPKKLRLIPHPSYLGVYEPTDQTLNRPLAPRVQTRFLVFGAMRGNRELDRLQLAAKKLASRGYDFQLSVVGRVFRSGQKLARQMDANPNVSVVAGRVPNDEVPVFFSQAHAYLLPSTTTFTSGTAMLAQSFGLPIIGPDIDPHKQTTPEECHNLLYPAQHPRGLIRMMRNLIQMSDEELEEKRRACFKFASERNPKRISNELKHALQELNSN